MELAILIICSIFGIVFTYKAIKYDEDLAPLCVYPIALSFLSGLIIYFKYIKPLF
jgi:hypothetical protein